MELPLGINLEESQVWILAGWLLMAYFQLTEGKILTDNLFLYFSVLIGIGLFKFKKQTGNISYEEARDIAVEFMEDKLKRPGYPSGTLSLEEGMQTDIVLESATEPSLEPHDFLFKFVMEPLKHAFVIRISRTGMVRGCIEIMETEFHLRDIEDKVVSAGVVKWEQVGNKIGEEVAESAKS